MESSQKKPPQTPLEDLDPRRAPPWDLRDVFKRHSRATVSPDDLAQISDSKELREPEWVLQKCISQDLIQTLYEDFQSGGSAEAIPEPEIMGKLHDASIYESTIIPGRTPPDINFTANSFSRGHLTLT